MMRKMKATRKIKMFWISKELMRWSNGDIKYQIGVIKVNNPNISIMYLGAAIVLHFWS